MGLKKDISLLSGSFLGGHLEVACPARAEKRRCWAFRSQRATFTVTPGKGRSGRRAPGDRPRSQLQREPGVGGCASWARKWAGRGVQWESAGACGARGSPGAASPSPGSESQCRRQ